MVQQNIKKQFIIQTKYRRHLAIFESDEKGYIATVPGLQGAITWGANLAEAKKMAKEVIELCNDHGNFKTSRFINR